jgi:hypothetical protein
MRLCRQLVTGLFALALLTLSGCGGKLNDKRTVTVKPGTLEKIFYEGPLVDKATVSVKSPGAPVGVHIVYAQYADAAADAIQSSKPVKDEIVGIDKTEDKPFDFAPGKKPFAVLIVGLNKAAEVQVTVTGQ